MADENRKFSYLGDGVYVHYDGYGFWLHINSHENPTDRAYLEPSVLLALVRFAKRQGEHMEAYLGDE